MQVKQKAKRQSKKAVDSKKILPMKEYIDQLMAKMTLQEKIGQLNLMVAGDITTGNAMDTQVAGDITAGRMGGVFNIKGFDKIKALQDVAIRNSRLGIPLLVGMDVIHGYETIFPIPIALSCTWSEEALRQVALCRHARQAPTASTGPSRLWSTWLSMPAGDASAKASARTHTSVVSWEQP